MPTGFGLAEIVNLLAALASLVLLLGAGRRLRREARATARAPLIAIASTLLITFFYFALAGTPVNEGAGTLLLVVGFVVGLFQGRASQLYYQERRLLIKRDTRYLLWWGIAYLVVALLPLLGSRILHAAGLLALLFSLGVVLGANLTLLLRQAIKRPPKVVPLAPALAGPSAAPAKQHSRGLLGRGK